MSIMSGMRDTLASLSFERALREVRDLQIQRMLDGRPLTAQELQALERDAALQAARQMYCDETALAWGMAEQAGQRDHRKDYASRSTASADMAVLATHRQICRIPIVGDPELAPR
jgi:hypothetical protein